MICKSLSNTMFFMVAITTIMCCVSCNNSKSREQEKQRQELIRKSKEIQAQVEGEKLAKEAEEKEFIVIEEERRKNNRNEELLQWLQGNWEWSGTIDGYRNSCRLGVSDDYAVLATPRGLLDQGKITIDFDDNTIHFGSTYMNFDMDNGRLGDFSNGMYYRRMSGGSGSRSSYSGGGSNSSSSNNSSNSRLMSKFNSLNEEGRRLTDEVGSYYRTGQASPYTIQAVYRLKQIQDEKIDLARQMGERDLENLCRQQKVQTLTALRQMGF